MHRFIGTESTISILFQVQLIVYNQPNYRKAGVQPNVIIKWWVQIHALAVKIESAWAGTQVDVTMAAVQNS